MKKVNRYFKEIYIKIIVKIFLLKIKKTINFFEFIFLFFIFLIKLVLKNIKNGLLIIEGHTSLTRQGFNTSFLLRQEMLNTHF